jgi:hypothetical protein
MRHHVLTLIIVALCFAPLLPLLPDSRAHAAAPAQIYHARISVPLPPAPPTLVLADGFEGLASAGGGVYYVSLADGLAFGGSAALMCAGTKPGVTCSVDLVDEDPCTNIVVYRERWGQPENGDVWIWGKP